jgi:hypothetical protein
MEEPGRSICPRFVAVFDGVCQPNGGVWRFSYLKLYDVPAPRRYPAHLRKFVTCSGKQLKSGTVQGKLKIMTIVCACKEFERERASKMVIFAGRNRWDDPNLSQRQRVSLNSG